MRKWVGLMVCVALLAGVGSVSAAEKRDSVASFFVGCCLGVRTASAYNEGKDLHWRDWGPLIPYAGIVIAVMNGIEASNGCTTSELATQYGGRFY